MCDCITKINDLLEPRNTKLSLTFVFGSGSGVLPTLTTEQIATGRGKPKAVAMLPSYCPFCGDKYE